MKMKFVWRAVSLLAVLWAAISARAGFQYNSRDVVIGFRETGGGSYDLLVDAGAVSNFYSLPVGQTITVANLTASQLSAAFSDLNDLSWSAFADVRTTGDANFPFNTIWVTSPRSDFNAQTSPWVRKTQTTQGNAGSQMDGITGGGVSYGNGIPTGPDNTTTGILEPEGNSGTIESYFTVITSLGNFHNTFQGDVEQATPDDFTTGTQSVRADFYQLIPDSSSKLLGTYLGYFEFSTNGVLTYTSGPSSIVIPPPTILSITRNGATNNITFTTVSGGTYSLLATNSAGLTSPRAIWPVTGSSIAGTGSSGTLSDVTTNGAVFYIISAH